MRRIKRSTVRGLIKEELYRRRLLEASSYQSPNGQKVADALVAAGMDQDTVTSSMSTLIDLLGTDEAPAAFKGGKIPVKFIVKTVTKIAGGEDADSNSFVNAANRVRDMIKAKMDKKSKDDKSSKDSSDKKQGYGELDPETGLSKDPDIAKLQKQAQDGNINAKNKLRAQGVPF